MFENVVVVSRHLTALDFIAGTFRSAEVDAQVTPDGIRLYGMADTSCAGENYGTVRVLTGNAVADDVRGKWVIGNVPLSLAALAARVYVIEFSGMPPHGQEYTLEEMLAAGAHLASYTVRSEGDYQVGLLRDDPETGKQVVGWLTRMETCNPVRSAAARFSRYQAEAAKRDWTAKGWHVTLHSV